MRFLIAIPFLGVLFGVHWLIYKTTANAFDITNRRTLAWLGIILGLLTLSFIVMTFVAFRYYNVAVRVLYTASATWLGVAFYLFIAAFVYWGIVFLFNYFAPGLELNRHIVYELLLVLVLLTCVYGIYNATQIRATVISPGLPNLPAQWQGKTAVWVSDIHLGDVRSMAFSEFLAKQIQDMHPDAVFIGGDFYDGVAVDADALVKPFAQIQTPMGVYFVTGNHEEFTNDQDYMQAVSRAGIKVLNNEMVNVDGVQLIGVDYRDASNPVTFKSILDRLKINPRQPSILLKHVPNELDIANNAGISFQLSGHTHHGQIWPVGYITAAIFKGYDYGFKKYGNMDVYTSDGVGTWGIPMRIGANPEIVLIKF